MLLSSTPGVRMEDNHARGSRAQTDSQPAQHHACAQSTCMPSADAAEPKQAAADGAGQLTGAAAPATERREGPEGQGAQGPRAKGRLPRGAGCVTTSARGQIRGVSSLPPASRRPQRKQQQLGGPRRPTARAPVPPAAARTDGGRAARDWCHKCHRVPAHHAVYGWRAHPQRRRDAPSMFESPVRVLVRSLKKNKNGIFLGKRRGDRQAECCVGWGSAGRAGRAAGERRVGEQGQASPKVCMAGTGLSAAARSGDTQPARREGAWTSL